MDTLFFAIHSQTDQTEPWAQDTQAEDKPVQDDPRPPHSHTAIRFQNTHGVPLSGILSRFRGPQDELLLDSSGMTQRPWDHALGLLADRFRLPVVPRGPPRTDPCLLRLLTRKQKRKPHIEIPWQEPERTEHFPACRCLRPP